MHRLHAFSTFIFSILRLLFVYPRVPDMMVGREGVRPRLTDDETHTVSYDYTFEYAAVISPADLFFSSRRSSDYTADCIAIPKNDTPPRKLWFYYCPS